MIYVKLYEEIKARIFAGDLQEGDKLESKRACAARLGISVGTVELSYRQLEDEGYIEAVERSGYYVAHRISDFKPLPYRAEEEEEEVTWRFDFSYQGIDPRFPFRKWRRHAEEIYDDAEEVFTRRGDPCGEKKLRVGIARYLFRSRGIEAPISSIVVSSSTEALFATLFRMLPEDACFGVENPGYRGLKRILAERKKRVHLLEVGDAGVDPADVEESEIDVVCLTPSHQFPTGRILPITARERILAWAQEGKWIIEDDYDGEFRYVGRTIPAMASIDRTRTIYMGTFANTISPAVRVSFMVLPPTLARMRALLPASCPVPMATQLTLAAFMEEDFERHIARMRRIYREKAARLEEGISDIPALEIVPSEAGLHLVFRDLKKRPTDEMRRALERKGVRLPSMDEFAKGKGREGLYVLGFGALEEDRIEEAVAVLASVFQ